MLILVPVPRNEWRAVVGRLTTRVRPLRPAAPNLVAQRKPLEILLRLRPLVPSCRCRIPADPSDAEWQRLARLPTCGSSAGASSPTATISPARRCASPSLEDGRVTERVRERLTTLGLAASLDRVLIGASPTATAEVTRLLASTRN